MKEIELYFYGYTWEKYAYQIVEHPGIYVVYLGHLDSEGFVVMNKVLYVGYHKRYADILDSEIIDDLKSLFSNKRKYGINKDNIKIICKGKCELIPNEIGA